ncbi:hypothetical protein D3C72_2214000 [compost metagenome]
MLPGAGTRRGKKLIDMKRPRQITSAYLGMSAGKASGHRARIAIRDARADARRQAASEIETGSLAWQASSARPSRTMPCAIWLSFMVANDMRMANRSACSALA